MYWPCKSPLLKGSTKTQQMHSMLAHRTPRLFICDWACHQPWAVLTHQSHVSLQLGKKMKGELLMRELHLWQLGELMARALEWCKKTPSDCYLFHAGWLIDWCLIIIPMLPCIVSRVVAITDLLYVSDWSLDVDGLSCMYCLVLYLYKASVLPIVMANWVSCLK